MTNLERFVSNMLVPAGSVFLVRGGAVELLTRDEYLARDIVAEERAGAEVRLSYGGALACALRQRAELEAVT